MNGVCIDMKNENALYTVSMLAAIAEKENKNYLDLLTPFILHCLPSQVGEIVDIGKVTEMMEHEYGFVKFPRKVAEKLLDRLSGGKDTPYVERVKGKKDYRLVRIPNNEAFDAQQNEMREKIDRILVALQQYLENNYACKQYPKEQLKGA